MMALIQNMSAQRSRELRTEGAARRRAARARRTKRNQAPGRAEPGPLTIRRIDPLGADRLELERVAGRDSATAPSGEVIGAERDGHLVAAVSLTSGELVADPFVPTADARSLLHRRATLLRASGDSTAATARHVRTSPHAP